MTSNSTSKDNNFFPPFIFDDGNIELMAKSIRCFKHAHQLGHCFDFFLFQCPIALKVPTHFSRSQNPHPKPIMATYNYFVKI